MAKLSVVVRNNKRKKMVEKYAERRKELKEAGDYAAHSTSCLRILQKSG